MNDITIDTPEPEITEDMKIESLRETAKNLGCNIGNTRNVDKLQAMINEVRESTEVKVNKDTANRAAKMELRKQAMALVRVRVVPMSPFDKQLKGNTFGISNKLLGHVRRHVPFNEIWHVERCLLNVIESKKYRYKIEKRDPTTGRKTYENGFAQSYNIAYEKPLTKKELDQLARDQKARNAID